MTAYLGRPLVAFDTETSGIDVEQDRIVSACVAMLRPAKPLWVQDITGHLIAVEVDIPEQATAVHGITTKHAREHGTEAASTLHLIADQLANAMLARIPIVGCNVSYDFTILDRELRRHDLPTLDERIGRDIGPVIDCLVLDKHIDPYRKGGRKLVDLCEHYDITFVGAHDSTADALAAARVAYRIGLLAQRPVEELMARYRARKDPAGVVERLRALSAMSVDELHKAQVTWRFDQQASLAEYFRKQGKPFDDVDGAWPMKPWPATASEAVLHA